MKSSPRTEWSVNPAFFNWGMRSGVSVCTFHLEWLIIAESIYCVMKGCNVPYSGDSWIISPFFDVIQQIAQKYIRIRRIFVQITRFDGSYDVTVRSNFIRLVHSWAFPFSFASFACPVGRFWGVLRLVHPCKLNCKCFPSSSNSFIIFLHAVEGRWVASLGSKTLFQSKI